MILGLDGADWRNALPLIRQGKLPVMAALRRAGVSDVMLSNEEFDFSPVLWTTIATGKLPEKHGVVHFMAEWGEIERPIPTPSLARRCRALWNIFSENGIPSGFVGWWVTWPAEPTLGFIVSDHFSVSRFALGEDYESDVRDREFYRDQTYPAERAKDIRHLKVPRHDIDREDLARFARLDGDDEWPEHLEPYAKESEFAIAHSVDRTHDAVGRFLLERDQPPLFGVYLEGIDIMQHFFWEFMNPAGTGTNPPAELRDKWGRMVESYYRWTDRRVGAFVEAGGDGRAMMIVSDHGFRPSTERWEEMGISGEHRREAFFLFAGPGVRRGELIDGTDAVDVTPIVLVYHGLPFGEDMDGRPVLACFTEELLEQRKPMVLPTLELGELDRAAIPDSSVARDLEERIRALGYIQ
jgi:predicted AlkP superfamily phosphohydrolase/phosphomutase